MLNSKLVLFYFRLGSVKWGADGIKWFGDYFDSIPIVVPNHEMSNLFSRIYKGIVENNVKESLNDLLVYKLYDLTYDECQIIDPEIGKLISRADYERMDVEELAEWELSE